MTLLHADPAPANQQTWQVLQRHVMHNLVVATLKESGVDGHKWRQALASKAGCKGDRVLLCNAHVIHAFWEDLQS